jgi:hypothetical protein
VTSITISTGTGLVSNYVLTQPTLANVTIAQAPLTATLTGTITKTYDGSTAAALTSSNYSLSGLVGSESFTVNQTSGTYNSKDVATATSVNATLCVCNFIGSNGQTMFCRLRPVAVPASPRPHSRLS